MSTTEHDTADATQASIADWLIGRLRFYDQVPAETITKDAPLRELGLDSIYVMTLCADIEDAYSVVIEPNFFAEYDTLGDAAAALAAEVSAQ